MLFALHVIFTGRWPQTSPFQLIFIQFTVAAIISCIASADCLRAWNWQGIKDAGVALLYVGVLSSGVAFCSQVVGQRTAPASHAAIILSFEAVFAASAAGGYSAKYLSDTELLGCGLILLGGLVSQLKVLLKQAPGSLFSIPMA